MHYYKTSSKRSAPVPPAVSDYIVQSVLNNEELLIRGCKHRMMTSNHTRKKAWENIVAEISKRFHVNMSAIQVQTHFNNRKKRVMYCNGLYERNYRPHSTDGHVKMSEVAENGHHKFSEIDAQLYQYFVENPPHRDYGIFQRTAVNADTIMMEGASIDPDMSDYEDHFVDLPPSKSSGTTIKNEPAAPSSDEQEFPSDSKCSNDSFEPAVPELDVPEVSDAELRRQRLETLKSEKRMFDKWTEMAAAHIKTYEEMISMQRETLQQVVDIVKGAFSAQHFRRIPSKRTSNGQTQCRESYNFEVF